MKEFFDNFVGDDDDYKFYKESSSYAANMIFEEVKYNDNITLTVVLEWHHHKENRGKVTYYYEKSKNPTINTPKNFFYTIEIEKISENGFFVTIHSVSGSAMYFFNNQILSEEQKINLKRSIVLEKIL